MATGFREAPEVRVTARQIIERYHPHLLQAQICYLFRLGPWEHAGKTRLGQAGKASPRENFLTDHNFFVVINHDMWQTLGEHQRRALVDHELSHCGRRVTESGVQWIIVPHDLEEFRGVVERHGIWDSDLEEFARAAAPHMKQMTIGDLTEAVASQERPATPAFPAEETVITLLKTLRVRSLDGSDAVVNTVLPAGTKVKVVGYSTDPSAVTLLCDGMRYKADPAEFATVQLAEKPNEQAEGAGGESG